MRPSKTDKILRNASEHLLYEHSMIRGTTDAIPSGDFGTSVFKNAPLESFAIHIRALLDFLYNDNLKIDDMAAEDFVLDPKVWKKTRPQLSRNLMKIKNRVGKEIAHLTYARLEITEEAKSWNV